MQEWFNACKGGPPAYNSFEAAAHVAEAYLPGILSLRLGRPIEWDSAGMKVPGTGSRSLDPQRLSNQVAELRGLCLVGSKRYEESPRSEGHSQAFCESDGKPSHSKGPVHGCWFNVNGPNSP